MSFPRYPKYKDSGVAWLGEVPAHWDVIALKRIADVQTGVAKGKDNGSRTTITVPYLRVANVQDGYLDLETVATIEIPPEDLKRYALRPGDVLMNEGGDFDKLGRGHVWDGQIDPCIAQNHVFAVRPRDVSSAWLNAVTGSDFAQFYFMTRSKQSTNLASIASTNLMELPVILPPSTEQIAISAFLDHETAKIDALVAEQQRLVELLKEKRQAVISHAVATGLDPDVPMQESDVPGLPRVPRHWKVLKMKWAHARARKLARKMRPRDQPARIGRPCAWTFSPWTRSRQALEVTQQMAGDFRSGTLRRARLAAGLQMLFAVAPKFDERLGALLAARACGGGRRVAQRRARSAGAHRALGAVGFTGAGRARRAHPSVQAYAAELIRGDRSRVASAGCVQAVLREDFAAHFAVARHRDTRRHASRRR